MATPTEGLFNFPAYNGDTVWGHAWSWRARGVMWISYIWFLIVPVCGYCIIVLAYLLIFLHICKKQKLNNNNSYTSPENNNLFSVYSQGLALAQAMFLISGECFCRIGDSDYLWKTLLVHWISCSVKEKPLLTVVQIWCCYLFPVPCWNLRSTHN